MFYRTLKLMTLEDRNSIMLTGLENPVEGKRLLIEWAKDRGYDGFVYKNTYEDKGRDSWVIFDSSQVSVAGEPKEIDIKRYHEIISNI